jgi:Na+/H+ antiporter NhaD/arsenite permease-like protein
MHDTTHREARDPTTISAASGGSESGGHHAAPSGSSKPVVWGIAGLLLAYALSALGGWPQYGRDLLEREQEAHHAAESGHPVGDHDEHGGDEHGGDEHDGDARHHGHAHSGAAPPLWAVIPFLVLLTAIAVFPLTPPLAHWWEHNSSKFMVAAALGFVTLGYYTFLHREPIDLHFPAHAVVEAAAAGPSWTLPATVLANALLAEYVPFIVLLFSLYCITGGVRIEGDLEATPTVNASFIGIGALAASFIGTTGAAMLLIRPLLETNAQRRNVVHTVVFFIFLVCNCGGCLLPIGDPPLFLGYLQGVDFLWTMSLWKPWLLTNVILLAIYWIWDAALAYPRERSSDRSRDEKAAGSLRITGLALNAPLMAGVILAVALLDPSKTLPGTAWHPWIYLREAVLIGLVGLSLGLGSDEVRRTNGFSYFAILEVAALFVGIFVCMQPALAILNERGASLGIESARAFFWITGALSSVLDNAPTYLVFFKTAQAMEPVGAVMAGVDVARLAGISLGAVFLGAMTYIGNGPNFMVKAIAEQSGVRMPSFFGYMLYSLGILAPVFLVVSFLFL